MKYLEDGVWRSTWQVSQVIKDNWYSVFNTLDKLGNEGKIERLILPGGFYWRSNSVAIEIDEKDFVKTKKVKK